MTLMLPSSHSKDYSAQRSDAGRFSPPADLDPNSANKPPTASNDSDLPGQTKGNNADAGGEGQAPITNDKSKHTTGQQAAPQSSPDENEDGGYVEGPRPDYDDYGQELGKNARFWKTYVKEAYRWDADMVDGWNKSLDLILIFAALFSAISTAFVIESSKSLQPDPAETSAQTLSVISLTLLAMANAQSGAPFNFTPPAPPTFVAPISAVCVNALWYLSLSLSVGVSLVALLGKDWARAYMAELTGQPYQQARKRQQRWDSLEKWRMPQVIMFLPIVLHLALLLFAVGLTIYLWQIHLGAAIPVLVVTLAATAAYVVSTVLPLVHKNCPYGTPLAQLLPILVKYFRELPSTMESSAKALIDQSKLYFGKAVASVQVDYRRVTACMRIWQPRQSDPEALAVELLQKEESAVPQDDEDQINEDTLLDNLTSRAIAWLLVNYEDTQSADIALQAIAGANTHLPMEPLIACGVYWLLPGRLDNCYATRQKTGKRYLKDIRLLEPATLYNRASAAVHMWDKTSSQRPNLPSYYLQSSLTESSSCLVDQSLKQCSRSPNKTAFALASWAIIELDRLPVTKWVTSTVELLQSHCNDSASLDSEALSMLVKSVSYVLGAHAFDHTPLLLALVRVLASSRSSRSQVAKQVGVALTCRMLLSPDTTSNQPLSGLRSEPRLDNRKLYCMRFLDTVKHPERIPSGLLAIGLLELLTHLPQTQNRSDLVAINETLQEYYYRPDGLEIQGFFVAKSGYNSRYLADVVIPRVRPADDGSFADSELVRATYLSVVNLEFLNTLTDPERLEALKLGLANLELATTNCLKQSCCNLISGFVSCDFFFENGDLRRGERVTPLLPLFPLLPLLPLLQLTESANERVLPYAIRALWMITDIIGHSNMSAEEKQSILEPVLSHEPFASARSKTNGEVCSSEEIAKDMGYAEVWLSRLEKIQGEALRHIYGSNILATISPDVWVDFGNSNSELDSRSIRGRALALYRRCWSADEAAGDRPLWPLDDGLATA